MEGRKTFGNMLFIGCDLSGIQKFLYNITSRKAAVSLKGRSDFLQSYMEEVCQRISSIPEIASNSIEVIYCSGGKAYLSTKNSEEVRNALDRTFDNIKYKLWLEHKGELSINLSYVGYIENSDNTVDTIEGKNLRIGILWKMLTEEFNLQKNSKLLPVILDNYEDFFEVQKVTEKHKVCAVTGVEDENCVPFEYSNKKLWILPSVKEQIARGSFLNEIEHAKTFEEYAKGSYLGVLRMDVDGLGKLFIKGFDSMEDYKSFSNTLQDFFAEGLRQIRNREEYRDHINIIYAGGDDIFAVGRWSEIIDFASTIHEQFIDCRNMLVKSYPQYEQIKDLSISGGIAIVGAKFPIAKAAEIAGEAEEAAKTDNGSKKNSINVFGETISWEKEFDKVRQYKKDFTNLIVGEAMSKGILHKLMTYSLIVRNNEKKRLENIPEDYSYIWHCTYYLTRFMERHKKSPLICAFCKSIRDGGLLRNNRDFILMSIGARWAELDLRENN